MSMAGVAELAGVSSATVSRVLNRPDVVSPKTRELVLAAVAETGYVPDARLQGFFRTIRRKVTTVGYLCSPFIRTAMERSEVFYARFLSSVQAALREADCHMVLVDSSEDTAPDGTLRCVADGVAEAIIAETSDTDSVAAAARHVPTVLFYCEARIPHVDVVLPDVARAAVDQLDHLHRLGHTHIACFRVRPGGWQDDPFWLALDHDYRRRGVALPDTYLAPIRFGVDEHPQAITAFLDRVLDCPEPPTAILTYDGYAGEICTQLAARGLEVPGDISLIGYDDVAPQLPNGVGLSSFRPDSGAMARLAVELLLRRSKTSEAPAQTVCVEGTLVERESTAPCQRGRTNKSAGVQVSPDAYVNRAMRGRNR